MQSVTEAMMDLDRMEAAAHRAARAAGARAPKGWIIEIVHAVNTPERQRWEYTVRRADGSIWSFGEAKTERAARAAANRDRRLGGLSGAASICA